MRKNTPFRIRTLLGALIALALLAGCFESKQEFTLNPDGSGKVVHECTFQTMDMSGGAKRDAEQQLKAAIREMMTQAKGVDAWSNVSYKFLDDGRVAFKGTAYFRSLSELQIPNQTMLTFNWTRSADGTGVLALSKKKKETPAKPAPPPSPEALKEARAKFQQAKPMMAMFIGAMKHDVVFHLPGKPAKTSSFQRDASGALQLHIDGAKMLEAMDALMNDDKWLASHTDIMNPDAPPPGDEDIYRRLFGGDGQVQATVTGLGAAAFDYDAEVAAASESYAALRQQLGARSAAATAAPAQSGELKSVQVVGMRLVRTTDESLGLQPFGASPGYALSLLAELPGSALGMTDECVLETAVADDGTDLLPESEWDRRISFPRLAENNVHVLFEATMVAPGPGVKGLKELSGHLQFRVAGSTKEVDLGFAKFEADSAGKELGAHIESIEGDEGSAQRVQLKLDCNPDTLKALYLVNGDSKTELNRNGYSGFNDSFTYTFESETGFPAKAKLVAEIYAELQTFNAPFKLENLTLFGKPKE